MNIDFKIVKNEKPALHPEEAKPLHCKARLVWEDAVLSDGSVCDKEMLDKLLAGVDLSNYAPPLLIQHEWDVRNVVGKMTKLSLDGDLNLVAEFDVSDNEAKAKISEGIWDSISISYELPDFKILECSVVAIPAIPGAKIEAMKPEEAEDKEEPEEAEDKEAEEQPAEEDKAEEPEEKPAEENACSGDDDEPEKKNPEEETVKNALSTNENVVIENGRVNNAATIDRLIKTVESLQRQNKELSDLIIKNDRKQKAETLLREWIANGKTLPANKEQEMSFVLSLDDTQLKAYTELKNQVVCNAAVGKRISNPVKPAQSRTEEFIEGYKRFIAGGLK